jgi:putative component of membrane protein insertase Oxa1/YidC/SpoIIIJ protein YidD
MPWNLLRATPRRVLRDSLLLLVAGYRRWVSPRLGVRCAYRVTCSRYATHVLERAPPSTAVALTLNRLYHCSSTRYRVELEELPDFAPPGHPS